MASEHPEVDITIGEGFLGDGVTGIKGVLVSIKMDSMNDMMEIDCMDNVPPDLIATTNTMRIELKMIMTSVKLGSEKVEEVTKEIMKNLERAIDF